LFCQLADQKHIKKERGKIDERASEKMPFGAQFNILPCILLTKPWYTTHPTHHAKAELGTLSQLQ
jgi:hypothetical protein